MIRNTLPLLVLLSLAACVEGEPEDTWQLPRGNGGSGATPKDSVPPGAASTQAGTGGMLAYGGSAGSQSSKADDPAAGSAEKPESCGDGLDNDIDGEVDEGCLCQVGGTQECFVGPASSAGVGICAMGTQKCASAGGEMGAGWGACEGSGTPLNEVCNGEDDDCDGETDEDLSRECANACGKGTETCKAGKWTGCTAPPVPAEICDNGEDDDCDGVADDGCECLDAGVAPWQIYRDLEVRCFGEDLDQDTKQFQFISVPAANAGGWKPWGALAINFSDPSTIPSPDYCGGKHWGAVFTYFQTFVDLPQGFQVQSLVVSAQGADDGWKLYVNGQTASDWYSWHTAKAINVTTKVKVGQNRIVLVHIDDNPVTRALANVVVKLNGKSLGQCQ